MGEARTTPNQRMFWLDILRILLCCGVVIHHYTPERPCSGSFCVIGFFVLSGFFTGEGFTRLERSGGLDICAFYGRKARRLLPTLFVALAVGFVLVGVRNHWYLPALYEHWEGGGFNLVYFVKYYDAPAWYMVVELALLLVAPLLYTVYRRGSGAMLITLAVLVCFAGVQYAKVPFCCDHAEGLYYQPQMRIWQLVAGMCGGMLLSKVGSGFWGKTCVWGLSILAAVMWVCMVVCKQDVDLHFFNYTFYFDAGVGLLFSLLVPLLARQPAPDSKRLAGVVAYLSALTFPIYLYHVLVYAVAVRLFPGPAYVPAITGLAGTCIMAALSLRFLDPLFSKKQS